MRPDILCDRCGDRMACTYASWRGTYWTCPCGNTTVRRGMAQPERFDAATAYGFVTPPATGRLNR